MDDAPAVVPAGLLAAATKLVADSIAPNTARAHRSALEAGVAGEAAYRALIGFAYRCHEPGVTKVPARRGQHWSTSRILGAIESPGTAS